MSIKGRITAIFGSILLVSSMAVVTAAPAAAHHDEEFTFSETYNMILRGMDANGWKNGNTQFNRGRDITHYLRGFRQHAPRPRWIPRQCRDETMDLFRDGFKYGKALSRYGRGQAQSWRYAPNQLRARLIARSQKNSAYRTLEDTIELWEDCILDYGRLPRRFR